MEWQSGAQDVSRAGAGNRRRARAGHRQDAAKIQAASRTICVGTTSVRAVESLALGKSTETDLFIRPGFQFQSTGAMLTNFHLPQSSLLMLVCALAGKDLVLSAYRHAVEAGYRFYSYGDCMLIL